MSLKETGYSPGENLEKLCEEIFQKIYPQIENQKIGVLSTVINLILASEEATDQLDSKEVPSKKICSYLNIIGNEQINDDLSRTSNIIGLLINNQNNQINRLSKKIQEQVKNGLHTVGNNLKGNDMKIDNEELFRIVVVCLIVGVVSRLLLYLQNKKGKDTRINDVQSQLKSLIPVALCLVIPASVVRDLRINDKINVFDIKKLIDNASYFLCTSRENAKAISESLHLTNEDITNVSEQREVYIRIDIADGEGIIEKKNQYALKRNLPTNEASVVRELACLKYLSVSGLEKFNRV